jgi:hypothetical protein
MAGFLDFLMDGNVVFMCFFYVFFLLFPRRVISVTTSLKEGRKLPGEASSGLISDSLNALCKNFANWSRTKLKFFEKSVVLVDSRTLSQPIGSGLTQRARSSGICDGRGRQLYGIDATKPGRMLFSIASANVRYCGTQPRRRSFALLTRLLLAPRLGCPFAFPIGGPGRFILSASQR